MKTTLKQMMVFVGIVEADGNMTQAAETLFLTQSACSMALTNFEQQLGCRLFERRGKKLLLNEIGREVYVQANKVIQSAQQLEEFTQQTNSSELVGHLVISASSSIGNFILPKIISEFMVEHQKVNISLNVSNTNEASIQVAKGLSDIGFIEGRCFETDIKVSPWQRDNLIIIASKKHPFSKKKNITPSDLYKTDWVLREKGSGTREQFEKAMSKPIKPLLELGSTEAIKQAVLIGHSISCVSKATVSRLLASGDLREISCKGFPIKRELNMIMHRDKSNSRLLTTFIDYCHNMTDNT